MGRLYLSFLGTNDYVPCTYYRDGDQAVKNVRFVQEATVAMYCRDWTSKDRIRIFTTEEAHKNNWVDGHFSDRESNKPLEGLNTCISRLKLGADIADVPIPDGKNEEEIWSIFKKVYDEIQENDIIVFDITHAFRSIPLLANVVMNYAKVLKRISIQGILYGAFEALGHLEAVRKMPVEERRVPIFNLTSFDALHDWTLAIDRFLGAGDAVPVCELATRSVRHLLRDSKGQDKAAARIRNISLGLRSLSQAISTCRGPRISEIASALKEEMSAYESLDLLPALRPLMERISKSVSEFQGDPIQDGIHAARWCLEHNLIQQGYTILNETLITHCLTHIGGDPSNFNVRDSVLHVASLCAKNVTVSEGEHLQKTVAFFRSNPVLAKIMTGLADRRNDLNHAGYRDNAMPPEKFGPNLEDFLKDITRVLNEYVDASGG